MGKLTAAKTKSLSQMGLHGDGGTLYLSVAPGWIGILGSTTDDWRQAPRRRLGRLPVGRTGRSAGRRRSRTASWHGPVGSPGGEAPGPGAEVSGGPPNGPSRRTGPRWRCAKVEKTWMQQMERHAFPILGDMPVDKIGREDVLRVLTPIWTTKPEAARKLRQRIRATLRWAEAHGHVEFNVAVKRSPVRCPPCRPSSNTSAPCPTVRLRRPLATVEASGASLAAKLCLRLLVLTAARSGEARGATWAEIDLDAREWRISAGRMKAGVEHRVPLSDAALAVLEQARPLRDDSDLIFLSPMRRGRPLSDMTLTQGVARHRTGGSGDGSWLPVELPGLVRRDREAARDC